MTYKEQYNFWLNDAYFDAATKAELKGIEGNEAEIEDRSAEIGENGVLSNSYGTGTSHRQRDVWSASHRQE